MAWIGTVLLLDSAPGPAGHEAARQAVLGLATWAVLIAVLRRQPRWCGPRRWSSWCSPPRWSTPSRPLLEAYIYRIGTVPPFVPPGHGLVYLAAPRSAARIPRPAARPGADRGPPCCVGGGWAACGPAAGAPAGPARRVLVRLPARVPAWGPHRPLYVGAFVVVSYLELLGTALGTWSLGGPRPGARTSSGRATRRRVRPAATAGSTCTRCSPAPLGSASGYAGGALAGPARSWRRRAGREHLVVQHGRWWPARPRRTARPPRPAR